MDIAQISGHIAFLLIACSFLVQDILTLRVISILSSFAAIWYNFYAIGEPLWLVINWNIIFIVIHALNIGIYFYRNRTIHFNKDESLIYEKVFKDLSHSEFLNLMEIGNTITLRKGTMLMKEGKRCNNIALILNGKAILTCKNKEIAKIEKGCFIGEDNLFDIKCDTSKVTIKVLNPLKVVIWKKKDLMKYLNKNRETQNVLLNIINENMTKKLRLQAEAL